jgi:zinc transporter 1/2/3
MEKLRKKQLKEKNQSEMAHHEHKKSCGEKMTPFVLLIGLGVHAMFEGLSLGMSQDVSQTMIFAIAILMHKGAAGMSLGISMAKTFKGEDRFVV